MAVRKGSTVSRSKLTTCSLLAVALLIAWGIGSAGASPPRPLQGSGPAESTTASSVAPRVTPLAGLQTADTTRPWITHLRIPVVVENTSGDSAAADLGAFDGLAFTVQDASGVRHGVDISRPDAAATPNHSLRFIDPGMAARWTIGFAVPTATASKLVLELWQQGSVVSSWQLDDLSDITASPVAVDITAPTVELGEAFAWQPGVTATSLEIGSLVCGAPTSEMVTQVVAVTFAVANRGATEVRWPGYIYRDRAPVAQWSDGTAADMSMETHVGERETLPRVSTSAVRIPAMTDATRAIVFATPRDGRFTDPSSLPVGVMMPTPEGDTWIDLRGADATIGLSPAFCDLGFFAGPLPFGYSPGPSFAAGSPPATDPAEIDSLARQRITEALAGAALFYDAAGQSFDGVAAEDLAARAPRLTFVSHDVGAELTGEVGVVYYATRQDDDDFIYMATLSASGRWFCAGVTPHRAAIAADGFDLTEISEVCFPESLVEDA